MMPVATFCNNETGGPPLYGKNISPSYIKIIGTSKWIPTDRYVASVGLGNLLESPLTPDRYHMHETKQ